MNYIEMINFFWQSRRVVKLTSTEADLYFFLLQESNQRNWENPFECSNVLVCATLGLSEQTMMEARNRLQRKGMIRYQPGVRNTKSPSYELFYPKKLGKKDGTDEGTNRCKNVGKEVGRKQGTDHSILYKTKTKTETKKRKEEKKSSGSAERYPFASKKFAAVWNSLLGMPKWKKKPARSLQLALNKLSTFDEAFAIELIEQAIAGDWQGVVYSDTQERYQRWMQHRNGGNLPGAPLPTATEGYKNTL